MQALSHPFLAYLIPTSGPDSFLWEKFMYPTVEALKCKTQIQATEEEILETLDLPNKAVDQFF